MGKDSKIEWTEHTFNTHWGCTKVSEGCTRCYAESFAKRTGFKIWGQDTDRRFFGAKHWGEPIKWDESARQLGVMHRVFCGSMCDILEDRADLEEPRRTVFNLSEATPNLLWLFLSKRPENALRMYPDRWKGNGWPRNVMAGFTIENQVRLDERMPHIHRLRVEFPGVQVFLSCEPLLSALEWITEKQDWRYYVDWIVAGGESGPGARACHPDWARKLRDDCRDRTDMGRPWPLPFLWKQWGEWAPCRAAGLYRGVTRIDFTDGTAMLRLGKKAAGRELDGRTWDQLPYLSYGPQLPGLQNYGAVVR